MGEEGGGGDDGGAGGGEAVGVDVFEVEGDLEGVGGAEALLEQFEVGVEVAGAGGLGFDEEPGGAVAGDEEVDLALEFVADVEEVEGGDAGVGPEVDRLEEVGGGEVFESGARVGDEAPVPEVEFGLSAEGFGEAAGPGAEGEAVEEGFERGEPSLGGVDGDVEVPGEVGEVDGPAGAGGEEETHVFDAGGFLDAGEVAKVVVEEELGAEAAPAVVEAFGGLEERFGVAAEAEELVEGLGIEAGGWAERLFGGEGMKEFGDGEGVKPVEEVAAHQAVAGAAGEAEAGAAGDDEPGSVAVGVEEPFEEISPAAILVEFVEDDVVGRGGDGIELEVLGQGVGASGDGQAVGLDIPGAVVVLWAGALAGGGGLSGLAWAGDHGDLAVVSKVISNDAVVDPVHDRIITEYE